MRRVTAEALTDKLTVLNEKAAGLSSRISDTEKDLANMTATYAKLRRKIADLNEELSAPVETQAEEIARDAARAPAGVLP